MAVRAALEGASATLPISESAHRALEGIWIGADPARWASSLAAHVGALLALGIVVRERLGAAIGALGRALLRRGSLGRSDAGQDAVAVLLGAMLSAGVKLAISAPVARLEQMPLAVGAGLVATAATLAITPFAPSPSQLRPRPMGALAVGLLHGLGSIPGGSQVGAAFVGVSWLGTRGWRAVEFALMLTAATLTVDVSVGLWRAPRLADLGHPAVAVAVVVALLATVLAANLWRLIAEGSRSLLFLLWIVPLAIAMLGLARATEVGLELGSPAGPSVRICARSSGNRAMTTA